ncbi:esterase/lipase family protein [Corynebacterium endometrii]|uniref:Extracellular esterase EstB n=1 Tax=Corynebacterium endometrii TaxID=2488819 RepID=A0A4P7QDG9_9CORY|nr:triacylglycerol lipase [Corynebacterium endometrii]QCB27413.1 Extracellular esterase EstB precursor [Corynebacterium endometrii]
MSPASLPDIRSTISTRLKKYWPRTSSSAQDLASANALREEVAAEIAAKLRATKRGEFTEDGTDTEAGTGEDAANKLGAAIGSLALGARLKPRGIFEDDWTARPTEKRPWPVIMIHGTCESKGNWQQLGEALRKAGWAAFAPDFGNRATGVLEDSARQIGAYIEAVLQVTGAEQVILVGHSQGGLLARYWMRTYGTAHLVRHVFCVGSPNHGTTQGGIISPLVTTRRGEEVMASVIEAFFGAAGAQQIVGSPLLEEMAAGGDLEPGVRYTCIATRADTVVVPPESCFLDATSAPEGTVRNIYVQDFDRLAVVLHQDLPMDKRVIAIITTILEQL